MMKNYVSRMSAAVVIVISLISFSCGEDEESSGSDCYTCDECTGQFANILNGREYCVDGFDNRSDWEANRNAQETDSGCTCTDS